MVDETTKTKVRQLLAALRERPTDLPISEVIELAEKNVAVTVDRAGSQPVVYVSPRPDSRFEVLTKREFEVATLVAAGFTNNQIADTLFISLATVKDHVHSILTKTDLASRSEVAACWYGRL
ncbi:MAG: LuxR C-terminal-related transcriptional regulator [Acidimicrobiia bacterium]